jgi:hypothetical protein
MDSCPGPLSICMSPGFVFDGVIQLVTNRRIPVDWPVGTDTRMRISWGTGTELVVPGVVDGSYLRFHLTGEETEQIPRRSLITIDINYDSLDPDMWRPWRQGWTSSCL